ncbi:Cathepsin D [Frankliniella fusca]|uniref:Cathepsin D n=1 Tax=Frankliniella fusca TaxID=407009 RepID=A0AAE1H1T9_9NEOP|nr:Cathepsin D [Frankliniella fusca]
MYFWGPFYAYATKVYNCDVSRPEKILWRWHARFSHFKPARPLEPQRFTGNISGTTIFNDSYWGRLVLDSRSNNQWKENAFVFNFPSAACTALLQNAGHMKQLLKPLVRDKPCAILPGVAVFNDQTLTQAYPNIPVLPYGEFRLRAMSNYVGISDPAACLATDFVVNPRH